MATILVIDDEPGIRQLLGVLLERKGYDVILASSGTEGLATFRKADPDAVVVDLKMPGVNGLEVLKEIRATCPQKPVIVFTGAGMRESEETAIRLGAVDCIQKEFSLHRLGQAIRRALDVPPLSGIGAQDI